MSITDERLREVLAQTLGRTGYTFLAKRISDEPNFGAVMMEALRLIATEAREMALEEAALKCMAEAEAFLSPQYATDQPLSSLSERIACGACAASIRASREKPNE